MPDSNISQLPPVPAVSATDYVAIDRNGVTMKATVAQLNSQLQPLEIASAINNAPSKATLDNGDKIAEVDANTGLLSHISGFNLKAVLSGLYAALHGSVSEYFSVAAPTSDNDAINRGTADSRYPQIANLASLAGFLNSADVTATWNNTTRELTVSPTGASFKFYANNVLYEKTITEVIGIPDVTGSYYFYYDPTGTLTYGTSFNDNFILVYAFVASVYWNGTTKLAVPDALLEAHTSTMPAQTHLYIHSTIGTAYDQEVGGLLPSVTIGDGSSNTHVQFTATPGAIWDDDVQRIIPVKQLNDAIPILYKTGATPVWTFDETSSAMVRNTGTGRAAYNQLTGGSWQVTEVTDNYFVLMHLFAIPGITKRWMMVMGVNEYADINAATAAAKTEITTITGIPFAEHKDIATFIIQTNDTYTNTYKSKVVQLGTGEDFFDWRFSEIGGAGASGTGGDVVGPVGAVDGDVAVFDGATGKLLKDGGTPTALIGTTIHATAGKATLADADELTIWSSALDKITYANFKTLMTGLFGSSFAAIAGSASQVFSVAAATATTHAVRTDKINGVLNITSLSGTTLGIAQTDKLAYVNSASATNYTIPSAATYAGIYGFVIYNLGAGVVTLNRTGTNTFYVSGSAGATTVTLNRGEFVWLVSDSTNWIQRASSRLVGSSTQVFSVGTATAPAHAVRLDQVPYPYRNRLINGDISTNQIYNPTQAADGTAVTPTVSAFVSDQWQAGVSQASKLTFQQVSDAPAGLKYSMKISVASQYAPLATDFFGFFQAIEGQNIVDFQLGTAGAVTIITSYWIKGSVAGTYSVSIRNGTNNRSYVGTVSVTTSWQRLAISLVGDTSGTWTTDSLGGLGIWFDLGSGSNYNTTTGSWQAGNFLRTSGSVTFVNQVASSTINITGTQIEKGVTGQTTPTDFEFLPYETQLRRAQRYLQPFHVNLVGYMAAGGFLGTTMNLPTTMRVQPTPIYTVGPTYTNGSGLNLNTAVMPGFCLVPQWSNPATGLTQVIASGYLDARI